jgi:hypothetical protein
LESCGGEIWIGSGQQLGTLLRVQFRLLIHRGDFSFQKNPASSEKRIDGLAGAPELSGARLRIFAAFLLGEECGGVYTTCRD